MKNLKENLTGVGVVLLFLSVALGPSIAIVWIAIHFIRKLW